MSLITARRGRLVTGGPPTTVEYLGNYATSGSTSSFTRTSQPLGTPASNRLIVLCIGTFDDGTFTNGDLLTGTIAGVSLTHIDGPDYVSGSVRMSAMYRALVPTGTTGDIFVDITPSLNVDDIMISWYAVYSKDPSNPVHDTARRTGNTNPTYSETLDIPEGGAVIGCMQNGDGRDITWPSPMTTDFTFDHRSNDDFSSGHAQELAAQTGFNPMPTFQTSTSRWTGTIASFV